jgi:hypothetical protein
MVCTLPRLQDEIEARTGQRISKSRLSVVMRKKWAFRWRQPRHTLKARQDAVAIDRAGLRLRLLKQQASRSLVMAKANDRLPMAAASRPRGPHATAEAQA